MAETDISTVMIEKACSYYDDYYKERISIKKKEYKERLEKRKFFQIPDYEINKKVEQKIESIKKDVMYSENKNLIIYFNLQDVMKLNPKGIIIVNSSEARFINTMIEWNKKRNKV